MLLFIGMLLDFPYLEELIGNNSYNEWHYLNHKILDFFRANYMLFFYSYLFFMLLNIFGIGKHLTAFVVYVLYTIKLMLTGVIFWGDSILATTLLFFIFVDSYQKLTLFKSKKSNSTIIAISNLAVISIIIHLFLVYFENAIYKLAAFNWRNGLAVFYFIRHVEPISTPLALTFTSNIIIAKLMSYGTLIFQALFFPLALIKRIKKYMVVLGIIIHVTIGLFTHLYGFQLIIISLYGFLFTDVEFKKIKLFRTRL